MNKKNTKTLKVTSHVPRDLLQNAQLFKHERSVVWEYVSNGLQYVDPATSPEVHVLINQKNKMISIQDNGRGMTMKGLHRFFQMHGENIDRKKGKPGRGFFGTGKSAAFGIANLLKVITIRNGKRSIVELHRTEIENHKSETEVPVRVIENEEETNEKNGTLVEISQINLKKIDRQSIVSYIERHIAHWPNARVFVNHQEVILDEPPILEVYEFSTTGTDFEEKLGRVTLFIKVSKAPLEEGLNGIAIHSKGVWHETTLAGEEKKPFSQYIFGEIDVPAIAEDKSPLAPFDVSRSMKLNRNNKLVGQLIAFIGWHVSEVRKELEDRDKERKRNDSAKKLASEAETIADLINKDFNDYKAQVKRATARSIGGQDTLPDEQGADEGDDKLSLGDEILAEILSETGEEGRVPNHGPGPIGPDGPPPDLAPELKENKEGKVGATKKKKSKEKPKPKGGFTVDFLPMGENEARAKYENEQRCIYINLDHPQLKAASEFSGIESPTFQRLAYEIAFAEYAIALAREMADSDWFADIADPIFEIRETLNRLSRIAAHLYTEKIQPQ